MELDYSPRQSGKTTRIVEWLRLNPMGLVVTFSRDRADAIKKEFGLSEGSVLSWDEYYKGYKTYGKDISEIVIDDVDIILQKICKEKINKVTFSKIKN